MKNRSVFVAIFLLALAAASFGQDQGADSQTLREILTKIRAIHEEVRVTETTQILLTGLEMQQGVVNRATENVDNARSRLQDVQRDQKRAASELQNAEDRVSQVSEPDEKKALAEDIERMKANVALLKTEESSRTTALQQMEQRLQTAQDSLDDIEKELNAIVARLHPGSK